MTTGAAGTLGYAPKVEVGPDLDLQRRLAERAKYERMWQFSEYRTIAPGEGVAAMFLAQARPKAGSEVIDFGAGTGRGALMLALMGGLKVRMLDFAENCLDEDVRAALTTQSHALSFTLHDLNRPVKDSAQYGFCTDVMEHIPPQDVDRVLRNILRAAQHVFFQISCEDDNCGKLIGEQLHLSVHPYAWWLKKLQELDCTVHWSQDCGHSCMFYGTAWSSGTEVVDHGTLNVSEAQIVENVRKNLEAGWSEVSPHPTNSVEVMILGGGPSLNGFVDDIKAKRAAGVKLITLNGSYNWAIEHGLTPSAQIMVDARPFNARFTTPVVPDCKYLLASQCDPSVFDGLPRDRTLVWHTTMSIIREVVNEKRELWFGVPGGSTVMLRAIPLLRMLGFKYFHLYGFDSCVMEEHHAYAQPENDTEVVIDTIVGGRVFKCHAWQIAQAQEFMDLVKFLGEEIELEVYGDGLISHILRTGAEISE